MNFEIGTPMSFAPHRSAAPHGAPSCIATQCYASQRLSILGANNKKLRLAPHRDASRRVTTQRDATQCIATQRLLSEPINNKFWFHSAAQRPTARRRAAPRSASHLNATFN